MPAEDAPGTALAPRRPLLHFTAPYGWLNDPNGLVHADGVFHLCYQHHPDGLEWGPMHWGHATSDDLVTWEHQPIALVPDHLGTAFSGSAVVDRDGVAGFGPGALLAFYTHHLEGAPQSQGIARSVDGGRSWQTFDGNPVVPAPDGVVDFRDPKVVRLPGALELPWVMVLVAGEEVHFYRSADLVRWSPSGRFGKRHGAHAGVWETPDLFELPVVGTGARRWVLTVSVQEGGPAGGSGTQYFVGDFDGATFISDDPPEVVRWVDHGADFYAPQSWSDVPGARRVWLAWMGNWGYAGQTPVETWRGAMSIPRDLSLVLREGRPVLAQQPVPEVDRVLAETVSRSDVRVDGEVRLVAGVQAADLHLSWDAAKAAPGSVEVRRGDAPPTRVSYDSVRGVVVVEPSPIGLPPGCRAERQEVPLPLAEGTLDLRIVVDTCSVELFADEGCVVVTNQVFGPGEIDIVLAAPNGPAHLSRVLVRRVPSASVEGGQV